MCNIPEPTTGLEAKFSMRLTAAMALAGVDTANIELYNAEITHQPRMKALRDKVDIDFRMNWPHAVAEMAIQLDDGTTHGKGQAPFSASRGPMSPSSAPALETKFDGLVTPVLGAARARRLHDADHPPLVSPADVGDLARAAAKA